MADYISATRLRSFVLLMLEYCSPIRSSSADSQLQLMDKIVSSVNILCNDNGNDLTHRRSIPSVYMLFEIRANDSHLLNDMIPDPINFTKLTRLAANTHTRCYRIPKCRTNQHQRSSGANSMSPNLSQRTLLLILFASNL